MKIFNYDYRYIKKHIRKKIKRRLEFRMAYDMKQEYHNEHYQYYKNLKKGKLRIIISDRIITRNIYIINIIDNEGNKIPSVLYYPKFIDAGIIAYEG